LCSEGNRSKAEEPVCGRVGTSSFDVDRDATTIEPLVSGQQFIALLCTGSGMLNCMNSLGESAEADRFTRFRFASQHAWPPIDPDMCDIAGMSAAAEESISDIATFA